MVGVVKKKGKKKKRKKEKGKMADGRVKERNVLDGALKKGKNDEVSLSIFAFLFSEFVQYTQGKVKTHAEWEERLSNAGRNGFFFFFFSFFFLFFSFFSSLTQLFCPVGRRLLELACFRDKVVKRETKIVSILSFIHSSIWKLCFGKQADSLEKSTGLCVYFVLDNV